MPRLLSRFTAACALVVALPFSGFSQTPPQPAPPLPPSGGGPIPRTAEEAEKIKGYVKYWVTYCLNHWAAHYKCGRCGEVTDGMDGFGETPAEAVKDAQDKNKD